MLLADTKGKGNCQEDTLTCCPARGLKLSCSVFEDPLGHATLASGKFFDPFFNERAPAAAGGAAQRDARQILTRSHCRARRSRIPGMNQQRLPHLQLGEWVSRVHSQ